MGFLAQAARTGQSLSTGIQGAQGALGRIITGSFWEQLRPASFRGVPFAVLSGGVAFGRKTAVHNYPDRDTVWVEDLGRAPRRFHLTGFLVGDDVIAQRNQLIAACETPGPGALVHPTLGRRTVTLIEVGTSERWEQGRVFEVTFSFTEGSQRLYPTNASATPAATLLAAGQGDLAAALSFATHAIAALQAGAAVVEQAVQTVTAWVARASGIVTDATTVFRFVSTLPGAFGRQSLNVGGFTNLQRATPAGSQTTQTQTGAASAARGTVASSAAATNSAASGLDASTASGFGATAQALMASVAAAAPDPYDAIRALGRAASYSTDDYNSGTPVGLARAAIQQASDDLFQRAAACAMARASAAYQPTSAEDAAAIRDLVLATLDTIILAVADEGDDGTYDALRAVRAAVVQDLNARGANLPTVVTVALPAALPALTLAQRLYQDATRADQLVMQADPVHPAFMPVSFQALSR